jgi:hypothetical protein
MHRLPPETDPAWQPDPDGTWWFRGQAGPMVLADVQSSLSCFQRDQSAVFFRGGDPRPRRGLRALFGCWARPLGASGPGGWVDQDEAKQRWDDGWELYWPMEGVWSVKDPTIDTTELPAAAPEPEVAPPVDGQRVVSGPLDAERVIDGVRFHLVEVDGRSVYVSELSRDSMQKWEAVMMANKLCSARRCPSPQDFHAYRIDHGDLDKVRPVEEYARHVRFANDNEILAFWSRRSADPPTFSGPQPLWSADPLWLVDHADDDPIRRRSLQANARALYTLPGIKSPVKVQFAFNVD